MRRFLLFLFGLLSLSTTASAQRRFDDGTEFIIDRRGVPTWKVDTDFPDDLFTFVRIRYNPYGGRRGKWATDYPDSDLNFSYRLHQLTSLKVNPNPIVLDLDNPKLFDYPFIYFCEPGGAWGNGLEFTQEDAVTLRKYFDNGGFAMFDDFWGEEEWHAFYLEIRKVFPDREPVDLDREHPIFHCVYDLRKTDNLQVPAINVALSGRTYERPDAQEVHYRAILDDNDRIVVMICHNTDLGDGWEREGENIDYFHNFSEKIAYPLGINIVFYAMTH
ncbi:MAG: DUF4159 domain-containing protein [Planctomycetaceae bacterium]|nr:DUF4159 domain-containing protein [Planctomycetaceae bacterium]MCB9953940.1 DUF4159 domain-containing protein [Planctomycetaceae bacterium]